MEQSIQTFEHHFKSGLALCDPDFPLSQWNRLLEQAVMTLNMLRSSKVNTKISAYTYLFGKYDYNTNHLSPPGTKVVAHTKSSMRQS